MEYLGIVLFAPEILQSSRVLFWCDHYPINIGSTNVPIEPYEDKVRRMFNDGLLLILDHVMILRMRYSLTTDLADAPTNDSSRPTLPTMHQRKNARENLPLTKDRCHANYRPANHRHAAAEPCLLLIEILMPPKDQPLILQGILIPQLRRLSIQRARTTPTKSATPHTKHPRSRLNKHTYSARPAGSASSTARSAHYTRRSTYP